MSPRHRVRTDWLGTSVAENDREVLVVDSKLNLNYQCDVASKTTESILGQNTASRLREVIAFL